ncbi:MAG: hypothetical protein Q7R87_03130 [Nanoarchaeota archaeon]|nr:hypothetical protein [Nanoarchaeota archaeon]
MNENDIPNGDRLSLRSKSIVLGVLGASIGLLVGAYNLGQINHERNNGNVRGLLNGTYNPVKFHISDMDGDGIQDLVINEHIEDGSVRTNIFYNDGRGSLSRTNGYSSK